MRGTTLEVLWAEILGVVNRIGDKIQGVKTHLNERIDDRFRILDSQFSTMNFTLAGSIGLKMRSTFMVTVLDEVAWILEQLYSYRDGFTARTDKVLVGRLFLIGLNKIATSIALLRERLTAAA